MTHSLLTKKKVVVVITRFIITIIIFRNYYYCCYIEKKGSSWFIFINYFLTFILSLIFMVGKKQLELMPIVHTTVKKR